MIVQDLVKKYAPFVGALVLAFLTGRYTMTGSVTKETEAKYERILSEYQSSSKLSYEQKLLDETETIRKEYEQKISKLTETEKTTVIDKDGKTTIVEKTKIKEDTESKAKEDSVNTGKTSDTSIVSSNEDKKTEEKVKQENKESIKTKALLPVRVYAITEIQDVTGDKILNYGVGAMYDILMFNVGSQGLYSPETNKKSIAITLGMSF